MIYKITWVAIAVISFAIDAFGQETTPDSLYRHEIADKAPEPIGGFKPMYKWLAKNISSKIFTAMDSVDVRKVYISYIITETGELISPEVIRGAGEPFDSEAIRLFENLPIKWIPGSKEGRNVKVKMVLPFSFEKDIAFVEKKSKKRKKK